MKTKNFSYRILVGITGNQNSSWRNKLKEIKHYGITEATLFLECIDENQRKKIYLDLLESPLKTIPLVHIRNDMARKELKFLKDNFHTEYFTIHEDSFDILEKWRGYYQNLFLEMNTDNSVSPFVDVKKIGGFCIDLAHYQVAKTKNSQEYHYVFQKNKTLNYFGCNHLNGYSYKKNTDLHTIRSLKDFDYLKTLPLFIFGKIIALECNNSISEQLKFKNYVGKILNQLFQG